MYYKPPSLTQSALAQPHIEVIGESKVPVTPNRAIVTLGAATESKNLEEAQRENARTVTNIINALTALGIPSENIQTSDYRIEPQYDYIDGNQVFRAYKVTHMLNVTVDRIEQTGTVVDTAVSNGANVVSNIQFTVSNPEAYYNQALSLAIMNGHQKAVVIANTLGVTLHRVPYEVREISTADSAPVPYQAMLSTSSAPTPIQPGQLQISAAVRMEYAYGYE